MKCPFCNSCLKIDRIDFSFNSIIIFICDLCGRIYKINNGKLEEVDDKSIKEARIKFKLRKVG